MDEKENRELSYFQKCTVYETINEQFSDSLHD